MSELKPCDHCGLTHNRNERCWEAMRHKLAEQTEQLSAALDAVKRRDAVLAVLRTRIDPNK